MRKDIENCKMAQLRELNPHELDIVYGGGGTSAPLPEDDEIVITAKRVKRAIDGGGSTSHSLFDPIRVSATGGYNHSPEPLFLVLAQINEINNAHTNAQVHPIDSINAIVEQIKIDFNKDFNSAVAATNRAVRQFLLDNTETFEKRDFR
jgi:hypothetical protein